VPSLCLNLIARLLPTAVLAVAGWSMTTDTPSPERSTQSASSPSPTTSAEGGTVSVYGKPPGPCAAVSAGTVKDLVPGAKTAGARLKTSDPAHRLGCSWHALDGFEFHWLDVRFEIPAAADGQQKNAVQTAQDVYATQKQGAPVSGLGDEASSGSKLTEDDGQQTTEAVVVVRKLNALITVTYSGSDFETKKGPSAEALREGALKAAKEAVTALGTPKS
jgi:hypothetical protein